MYLDPNKALERLRNEWDTHGSLIIAFDFDSTVMPYKKAEYKFDYEPIRELLRRLKKLGCTLICFTASNPERYEEIKEQLNTIKVPYDYFNQSPAIITGIGQMGKVYANVYIDDRAGLHETFTALSQLATEKELEEKMKYFRFMAKQARKP